MPLTPNNREEHWLQGMVDGQTTLEPNKRREYWYKEIVDAIGSGGGGGGTGGGVLVCNLDMQTMTLDKTWKEIYDAPLALIPVTAGNETAWMYRTSVASETGDYFVYFAQFTGEGTVAVAPFYTTTEDGYPVMQIGG